MTRGRKLGLLLLALAALLVLTIVVMELAPDGEGTEEATAVTIFTLDPDQVTSLTWQYEEETISLEKDQENNWTYPADAAFPLDQSYPDAMVQALKEIQAAKTIENVEDLSEYGLENAVCSITVQGEKEYQLAIGEETGLGGQRYLSIGDGNVYLVDASLLDTFALGLYDIVEKETIPSMTDLRAVQITTNAGTLEMEYQEDSGLAYSDQYTWFWKTDGGYTALDTDLAESLVQNITGLTWNSCVEYQASADDLGRYGLDKPRSPSATPRPAKWRPTRPMRTASRFMRPSRQTRPLFWSWGTMMGTPAMLVGAVPPWCTRWMEPCVTLFWPPMGRICCPKMLFCWTGAR